jgi:hypothetical protein
VAPTIYKVTKAVEGETVADCWTIFSQNKEVFTFRVVMGAVISNVI